MPPARGLIGPSWAPHPGLVWPSEASSPCGPCGRFVTAPNAAGSLMSFSRWASCRSSCPCTNCSRQDEGQASMGSAVMPAQSPVTHHSVTQARRGPKGHSAERPFSRTVAPAPPPNSLPRFLHYRPKPTDCPGARPGHRGERGRARLSVSKTPVAFERCRVALRSVRIIDAPKHGRLHSSLEERLNERRDETPRHEGRADA